MFPLAGALLLPRMRLPLNIFEPRYIEMLDDALSGRRMIGMVQPTAADDAPPCLHKVGCAGRITNFSETQDGRYLITLTGVCRFNVVDEIDSPSSYRKARISIDGFETDLDAQVSGQAVDCKELLSVLKNYLEANSLDANWDSIKNAPCETLINSLAMICPFEPLEKQALLEARDLAERAATLTALMRMSAVGGAPEAGLQ